MRCTICKEDLTDIVELNDTTKFKQIKRANICTHCIGNILDELGEHMQARGLSSIDVLLVLASGYVDCCKHLQMSDENVIELTHGTLLAWRYQPPR